MCALMTAAAEMGQACIQLVVQFLLMLGAINIPLVSTSYAWMTAALRISSRQGRAFSTATSQQHLCRTCHTQRAYSHTYLSCKRHLQAAPADVHRHMLDCVITATHLLRLWTNRPSVLQGSSAAPRLLTANVLSYVGAPWVASSVAKVRRHALTPGEQRACSSGVHGPSCLDGLALALW
jgi:hypothetical protein